MPSAAKAIHRSFAIPVIACVPCSQSPHPAWCDILPVLWLERLVQKEAYGSLSDRNSSDVLTQLGLSLRQSHALRMLQQWGAMPVAQSIRLPCNARWVSGAAMGSRFTRPPRRTWRQLKPPVAVRTSGEMAAPRRMRDPVNLVPAPNFGNRRAHYTRCQEPFVASKGLLGFVSKSAMF
jgi:hypothetical protein